MIQNDQALHIRNRRIGWWMLLALSALTASIYWSGLSGTWLFDDYPNIVDNAGVQPQAATIPSMITAILSSPSSEFKRPLSSLSFAANYLATGLNPYWMKLTNLVIHLLNGAMVFSLTQMLLKSDPRRPTSNANSSIVAALVAGSWMLIPINLTAVLYVVQRMESLANLFVLLGLISYVACRRRILTKVPLDLPVEQPTWGNFWLCAASIILPTILGLLAKETAVMLPLYALVIEWTFWDFRNEPNNSLRKMRGPRDKRLIGLFAAVLLLPMIIGLIWLVPGLLRPENWANRDFTLATRLLSEARVVTDYIVWTLLPTPDALSFYHDDFQISAGWLAPWSTLACAGILTALLVVAICLRKRHPLPAAGVLLFFACHLLTGTILPLELIYEHRNYFASFGLLLAVVPWLAVPHAEKQTTAQKFSASKLEVNLEKAAFESQISTAYGNASPLALPRHTLLAGLMLCWATQTGLTAFAWGNPLRLAQDLSLRAPNSPRAQYELGRTYIIYSHYDPNSPFTRLAYAPLERAAAMPESSILPQQALIFMNSRMDLPLKDAWWNSMIAKLKTRKSTVQDESSLDALTRCMREHHCDLPKARMTDAYLSALSHADPSARLLAMYGDYAWNVLDDHNLGERMTSYAIAKAPSEPAYRITQIRMLAAQGRSVDAHAALRNLNALNIGGRLRVSLDELRILPGMH